MKLVANFSNALRRRFLKSKQVSPYLNQGLSYTDAMRTARGKSLGINTTSPIVNTLQSRSYMTDPMDLSYVHSNLSTMNRNAPVLAGEVSTVANRLDNNRQVASSVKEAKDNWLSQRGLSLSELGMAPKGSVEDLTSTTFLQPERPNNRKAIGGITGHTHPMLNIAAPSYADIQEAGKHKLSRNMPISEVKDISSGKAPYDIRNVYKYDPYYTDDAVLDNFVYHQKSPTRSAVVHFPLAKASSDSPEFYNLINKYTQHPDMQKSYMNKTKMTEVYTNLASGTLPSVDQLKPKAYKSEQTDLLRGSYKAAKDVGIQYSQLGTVNKLTGKKR